jgi:hypothetical protein
VTEEEQAAAALLSAALGAHDHGATQVAVILFRALLERYPLSDEAAQALQYLQDAHDVRDLSQPYDDGA